MSDMNCKLTNADGVTRRGEFNENQWGQGVRHSPTGSGGLCTAGVIHFYRHPLLAVFFDPIHGGYGSTALLWEIHTEPSAEILSDATKSGCRGWVKTVRRLDLPTISMAARVHAAIRLAQSVYSEPAWTRWAEGWLSGGDRTLETASAAAAETAWTALAAANADAAGVSSDDILAAITEAIETEDDKS